MENDIFEKNINVLERIYLSKHVVVHPIVLLSVVDHYNRIASNTKKRVLGTILGEKIDGVVHITNSYALPFDEDIKDINIFFIDDNYNENLFNMIRKINTREKILGWYTTGSNIKPNDIFINEIFYKYHHAPIFLLVNVHTNQTIFPVNAYVAIEKAISNNKFRKTFIHIPVRIGAFEAEDVGVEFLLKELKSVSTSTLATKVGDKLSSLKTLISKLYEISEYLNDILQGNIEMNIKILYNLQNVFSLLPDTDNPELVEAFMVKNNDIMLNIFIGSITRSVIALHNLINNKIENKINTEKKQLLEDQNIKEKEKEKTKEK
ncbi:26S proteasome regulatory subunit RPN8, putative [Plasmodium berghei]|uniref:26S proteasome regulatory subunit RPN8, putative n=2 Tax=Plasmodium berghei TaxID=5821 RepID=A0A509AIX8_PLABA|nr:26S proteasome regulatory subunit RPN8, putative [Plasmodium berghei ANKA]CXI31781.1 26S proteasome regulatory subunit RPN8, putative [Plasmodium berghei]SCM21043.1 26S proteasome regulatory subunit RPN8, putative [Plasmodium berghei]SCN24430.1 26S proteasome regulatory subunit RPN8, putative [Plasmodium berghei]SCO59620.1 26S proteasome regulatory subunit RPN8, putative [Plasmodium berghei]SCO60807.1 26S proteasome regulatory subunit RPN8, putative [Plasmodium berghei]|eukprot:XP_034421110.1 26S proteasome regulatory subunit RPN8, putative [Plasmodium berghei ANKA]